jgi:hypothetical protein
MRSMFVQVPMQTGYGQVTSVEVALPYIAALIADGGKYYMERKRIDDATERRRYRHRGPTLRSLVKLARQCDNAEQLGLAIKRRYDRSLHRQEIAQPGNGRAEAALDQILGKQ